MKAIQIDAYGDESVAVLKSDVPKPRPATGQILVEVHAAGLNPADSMVRLGYMHEMAPLAFPATLGMDLAGVVVELGPETSGFRAGDRVFGQANALMGASGAFAEYAATSPSSLALMPANLDFVGAAALPLAGVSALQAIREHIALKKGQRLLVLGGAGAIGGHAIQIAKRLGAYIAAVVRGADAVAQAKKLGADEAVDGGDEKAIAALSGFDALLDTTNSQQYRAIIEAVKKGGIVVHLLGAPDATLMAERGLTGVGQGTAVTAERLSALAELVASGAVTPRVTRTFSLDGAQAAFKVREAGGARGKIVLKVR